MTDGPWVILLACNHLSAGQGIFKEKSSKKNDVFTNLDSFQHLRKVEFKLVEWRFADSRKIWGRLSSMLAVKRDIYTQIICRVFHLGGVEFHLAEWRFCSRWVVVGRV